MLICMAMKLDTGAFFSCHDAAAARNHVLAGKATQVGMWQAQEAYK